MDRPVGGRDPDPARRAGRFRTRLLHHQVHGGAVRHAHRIHLHSQRLREPGIVNILHRKNVTNIANLCLVPLFISKLLLFSSLPKFSCLNIFLTKLLEFPFVKIPPPLSGSHQRGVRLLPERHGHRVRVPRAGERFRRRLQGGGLGGAGQVAVRPVQGDEGTSSGFYFSWYARRKNRSIRYNRPGKTQKRNSFFKKNSFADRGKL